MRQISVNVKSDHLQSLTKIGRPTAAISELVWNGLDADADEVRVFLETNVLDRLETITVSDNGHGLAYSDVDTAFGNLGGSLKRDQSKTRTKRRLLHGRSGKGRFRAFSLGTSVLWRFRYRDAKAIHQYDVKGSWDRLGVFDVGDEKSIRIPASGTGTGTEVEVTNLRKEFGSLDQPTEGGTNQRIRTIPSSVSGNPNPVQRLTLGPIQHHHSCDRNQPDIK